MAVPGSRPGAQADGSYAGQIARLPGHTTFTTSVRTPDGREVLTRGRPPFAKLPVAWASGDRFLYGSNDHHEIGAFDAAGNPSAIVRQRIPTQVVTPDAVATYKAETMARAPDDPAMRRQWEESINTAPYPETFPAYQRIRIDRTGMLWVQEYLLPGETSATWSVFDPEGRWVSQVSIPDDWRVLDIGAYYLLVLALDELDVEVVRRHALERR